MKKHRPRAFRPAIRTRFLQIFASAITLLSCSEGHNPAAPEEPSQPSLAHIRCAVAVQTGTMACSSPNAAANDAIAGDAVIVGAQGTFMNLLTTAPAYDAAASVFHANVAVQNLIAQAIGTINGTTVDPKGVRVFFTQHPSTTGGRGAVTVDNPDGIETFTTAGQEYFQYNQMLLPGATSSPKEWRFHVPSSVTTFEFEVLVSAEVQHPNGFINVSPPATTLRSNATVQLGASVMDVLGRPIAGATTLWTSSNDLIATVASNGLVTAHAGGVATITGTSGDKQGRATITVIASSPGNTTIAASPLTPFVGQASTITVQVKDANGQNVTEGGDVVTLATTLGTMSAVSSGGNGTYTASLTSTTAGTAVVSGTLNGVPLAATLSVTFSAQGAATISKNSTDPQTAIAGANVGAPPSVILKDPLGNPVSGVAVTFAVASGGGSITGGTQTTDAAGIATAGSWRLGNAPGNNSVTATAGALTATFNATGTVGPAAILVKIGGDAQTGTAGVAVPIPPSVRVTDVNGNPVAGVVVTFSVASGGGSATGPIQTTNAAGEASVGSWVLGAVAGQNSLSATTGSLSALFTATSGIAGPANIAKMAGDAQSALVGTAVAIAPQVKVTDAGANPVAGVTVTFTVASGGGSITGGSQVTDAAGLATLTSWTLGTTAGANTLTATAGALITTFTATGTPGVLHHFLVEGAGGGAIPAQNVATPFNVRVTAQDINNNTVTSFVGTVDVTSNRTGSAGLTTSAAFTAGVLASHSITLTQAGVGATITATRTGGAETGTSNAFSVSAGAVHHFLVEAAGGGAIGAQTAGTPFAVRITAQDITNNTVVGFVGTADVTSNRTGTAGLTTTAAFTAGVLASHNVTLTQAGAGATVTATRTGGAETGTSNAFTINAGALHHFLVDAAGGGAIGAQAAGTPFNVRFTAQDIGNNTVTGFVGTVDVTSNRTGSAGLTTSAAFTAGVLASHSVTLTQSGAGSTITATRTGGAETGTSNAFVVNAGAVHHFLVEGAGGGAIAAQIVSTPFNVRFTAQDINNNTATGFVGTVDVTSNRTGSAGLTTSAAFAAGVLATHSVTLTQSGAGATITATRTGGTETGTSNAFAVNAGAVNHFLVEAAGGGAIGAQTAGTPFNIQVTAQDASNNTATAFTGTVDVTSNRTGSAGLTTSAAFVAGVLVSHSVTLTQAGAGATITATRTGGAETGTSAAFTVNAGAVHHFLVEAAGGGVIGAQTAGTPFNVQFTAQDISNNTATTFVGTVDVTSNRTGSAGLTTSAAFTAGVLASHSVTLTQSGAGSTITGTRTGGTETGTSAAFLVNAGAVNHFLVEAAGGGPIATQNAGTPFSIRVTAQDVNNNTATGFVGTVDVTSNRTGSAGLATSAAFTAGVLTTHSVTLTQTGAGSTITATRTGGAETGTSNAFTVNAGAVTHFLVEAAGGGVIGTQTAGTPFNIQITAQDASNNTVTGFVGTADITSNRTGSAGLTTTAAFTAGVLATHSVTLTQAGAASTITATRTGGAEAGTSTAFTVNAGALDHFLVDAAGGGAIATQIAGTPFNVRVTAQDISNNTVTTFVGTVDVTSNRTGTAGLTTSAAFTAGVLASHSITLTQAGAGATITATRTGGTETGTSNAFTVSAGAVDHFVVDAAGGGAIGAQTAGTPFNIRVTAQDINNNTATGFTGTVSVTSNRTGSAGLTTSAAFTAGVLASHSVTLTQAGAGATITATRTAGAETGTSNAFLVNPAPLHHFLVEAAGGGPIPTQTAGAPFNIQITAQDISNNTVTTFTGTADITSNRTGSAGLTTTAAFTAGVLATHSVTLTQSGAASTVTATRTGGTETGTSNAFVVTAGALDHFLVEATGGGPVGAQGAGTPFSVRITAQDINNNTATSFAGTVDVTSNRTGSAGLTTSAAFTAGVLAAHGLTLTQSGAGATITATRTGGTETGTSNAFTVNPGSVHHFVVEAAGGGAIGAQTAGTPFGVRITAQDISNNTVTTFTSTADVTSNRTGSAGLTTTAAFTAGVLVSHNVTLTQAGAGATITATRTGGTEVGTSNAFTVNPGALNHFLVEAAGGGAIGTQASGTPFNIQVTAQDASNNTVTSFVGTVDVTSNRTGTAGLTTTASFTAGVLATHSVTLTQSGAGATITATRTAGAETGTSAAFTVSAGALHHFLVEAAGGGAIGTQTAGAPFSVRVTAQDITNNTVTGFVGTVDVTSNRTGSAGLTTSAAFTAGVLTSHSITLSEAGAASTITATRTGGTETGTSNAFTVNAGAVTHFVVEAAGGGAIGTQSAGAPFNVRITAQDASNNTATGFVGTVSVTSNRTGSAGLTTTAAFTAGVLTTHSITLTQSGAGSTITATRTAGTETGTSNAFTVNPGALHHFLVEAAGGGAIAAQNVTVPFNIQVTAQDINNNTVTGFVGTTDITSNRTGSAGLTTTAAFTAGVLATHSVTLTQSGAGSTITATRTGGTETGTSNAFAVNAGAVHHFVVEAAGGGPIGTQTAAAPFSVQITAQDVNNNTATGFTGTADVTSNRTGSAGLATTAAFTAGVLATHSITLTQSGAGATITATRTGGTETGTSNAFTVNAGAVHHFVVEQAGGGAIGTQAAGTPFSIRITAQDASNNTASAFVGTADVTSNRTGSAGLTTTAAFTAGVLTTHSVTLTQSGAASTITATRTGGTETGTSNAFTVTPGALDHFLVEAAGGGAIGAQAAGTPFSTQFTAKDVNNNTVTAFVGTVDVTSNRTGSAGLTTSAAFTAGVLATHSITLTQSGAGSTITATRTGGTETGTSNAFTVGSGALDHFLVEAAGGGAIGTQTAGAAFSVRVTAQDVSNNTVTGFTGTADVTSNRTGSAGLTTSAAFTAGVLATHSITLTQAGAASTITATRTGGTETGTSNAFTVNPGALNHFLVEAAGGGPIATQDVTVPFSIRVTAQDASNNTLTTFTGTADITSNRTGSAGLTTTAAFTAGVLTTHSVTLTQAGAGSTITATRTGGSETGTSNAFTVNAGAVHHFLVEAAGGGAIGTQTAGTPFSVRVTAQDINNNTATGFVGTVDVTSNRTGSAGLATSAAFTAGVLTTHSITLTQSGAASTITATRTGGTETGTSNAFTVNAAAVHHFVVEQAGGGAIGTQTAGTPFSVRITAQDINNNTATGFAGTVDVTSNRTGSAGLTTSAAFTAGVLTTHSITLTQSGAASTITATRTGGTETGTSNAFTVDPGALNHFLVEAAGGGAIATQDVNVPFNVRFTAQDANNNTVTVFTGTVDVTSNRTGSAGLTTSAAFTAGVLASHTVTLTQAGAGSTITATRTAGTETGTSAAFTVNPGAVHHFVVDAAGGGAIGTQIAGTPFNIRVTAQDINNNTVAGFTGTADITSNRTGSAGLTTSAAFTAGVLASHSVTLTQSGAASTITATRTGGTETGTSNAFTVNAGAATHFVVEAAGGGAIGTQAAGTPFSVRITAQDASNNTATGFVGTVDVTSNRTGSAGLTTSAAFTAGVLTTHSITLTQSGAASTITATRTGGTETGTSNAFTVTPGVLDHFLVEAAGGGAIGTQAANTPFNIQVTAKDVNNNTVTGFVGTVDVTSNRTASAGLTTSAAFTAGVLATHSVTLTQSGAGSTITATRTGGTETGTSAAFTVNAGTLDHFLVEAAGGGAIGTQTAAAPFNIRVTAQDVSNNTVTGFTGTVDVTSNRTGSAGLTTTAAFTAGVLATHSVTLTQSGAGATLTATRTGGTETGTSNAFTVNAGALTHFLVEAAGGGPIATQTATVPFSIKVTALDASNNTVTGFVGTVDVTSNRTGSAGLTTSAAFTAGVLTTHSITLTQSGAASTVTATRTGGTETGTSNAFTVNAGGIDHFVVEAAGGGAIGTQVAGTPFSVRITAQDVNNNTATTFAGTAEITSNRTGSAGLATTAAFTAGVLTTHSITLTQSGAASTITATRTGGTEAGTSNAFTVNSAAVDHFVVEQVGGGAIGTQTAGTPFSVRITAQDINNNTATGFAGTVDVTSNRTGSAGLTTTAAFTAGVLTTHSITLTQSGAASTITATRTGGTETGTSNAFTVNPGALNHFLVEAAGGGAIATQDVAVPFNVQFTAQDANNNTVTAFAGTVDVTSNRTGSAGLTTSAAFTAGVLATHSVTLTQSGAGSTITATRTGGTETGTSNAFTVNAGAVHHFAVEAAGGGAIGTQTAGAAFSIRVTAQDINNNTATGFTGTADITSNRTGSAGLATTAAFTAGVLTTHSVTLTQSGAASTITATRTGGTETGTSNAFTVNSGAVDHFVVEAAGGGAIATQTAGAAFNVRITAQDASNNTVTGFAGTVDVTSNRTGSAGLTTTAAFTAGVLTTHSITLTQSGAASTITATRTGGTETGTSNAFTVNPGALNHFLVQAAGGGAIGTQTAGTPFDIQVTAQDASNNTVTAFTGTVDVTSNRTGSAGLTTSAAFTAGVLATHSVTLTQSGAGSTITATRTAGAETGTSNTFTVNSAAIDHFLVEAAGGGAIGAQTAGTPFSVRITAQDVNNNTVTGFTGTADITSNRTGSAGLTTTAAFAAGVLTTHSVTLTQSGAASTITATRTGGTETGTSNAFTVNSGAVDHFVVEAAGGGAIGTQAVTTPFSVQFTAQDANNNTVTAFTGTVDVTSNRTGSSGLTTSAAFTAGVLATHSVTLTQSGAGSTITATRTGGTETGTSNTFTVTPGALDHFKVEAAGGGAIGAQTAGTPFSVLITAQDANNNTATTFTGTVDVTSNRTGTAGLATSAAFAAGVLTSHSITLTQSGAGATITATRTGGTETGTSNAFTLNPGAVDHFLVEAAGGGAIGTQTVGFPFNVRFTAQDASNNTVTGFTGTVDVTSNRTGSAGLTTSAAFTAGVLTTHSVTLTQSGAGSTITATRTGGTETGTSNTFLVNSAALDHFLVEAAGGGAIGTQAAGTPFSVRITAQDASNNTVAGFVSTVDVTSNRTGTAGLTTSAAFTAGVLTTHSVTLTQTGAGSTITATRTGGTETGTSNTFTVAPGALDHFVVEAAGGGAIASQAPGVPFNIQVTGKDASNNTTTAFVGTVDISSTGTLTAGSGTTAAFTTGVLATHSVTISNSGLFTITATRTGGTETGTSVGFTIVTSPAVTTTTPVDAATGVAVGSTIVVNFNQSVSATTSSFTVKCPAAGAALPYALSASPASSYTLTPTAPLPAGTTCEVTVVAAQISDASVPTAHPAADFVFSFTTTLTASDDTYPQTVVGNVSVNSANIPFSVTTNDGADAAATITFAGFGVTPNVTEQGGTVTMTTSGVDRGKFVYDPPAGFTGTDHFTYTISGGSINTSATVTLTVAGLIWFIDNNSACAANCDGRISHPFTTLPAFQAVNDGVGLHPAAGHNIFIYEGASTYAGPITLLNNQRLMGQDASTSLTALTGITPPSGSTAFPAMNAGNGTHATIAGTSGGIALVNAGNASIYGLTVATTGGTAIASGATFGTLTLANGTSQAADLIINNTGGGALALSTGTLSGVLTSITSTGGTNNISLTTVSTSGTVDLGSGAVSGASSDGVVISTGTGSFTYSGSITNSTTLAVNVASKSAGTVTLSGDINPGGAAAGISVSANTGGTVVLSGANKKISTGAGTGVSLATNTGAVVNITGGGLAIATTSGSGFSATGGGTVSVTGTGNTIASTTGTALNVANTTIGAANLIFQSISASGGANGIVLNTTGALGGLTVTGVSGVCNRTTPTCNGGVIGGTTGADGAAAGNGIYLNNTANVVLNRMRINGTHDNFGIYGTTVNGFALDNVLMDGTYGNNTGAPNEGTVGFDELLGSAAVTNSYFAGGVNNNFRIHNAAGGTTLNRITFDTDTLGFTNTGAASNNAIDIDVDAGTTNVTVQNSKFLGAFLHSINVSVDGGGVDVIVQNNAFTNTQGNTDANFGHFLMTASGVNATTGSITYAITNNNFQGSRQQPIAIAKLRGQWQLTGSITGNTIGTVGVPGSGSTVGNGILLLTTSQGKHKALINNNNIFQYGGGTHAGIWVGMTNLGFNDTGIGTPNDATMHLTITRNTISNGNSDAGGFNDGIELIPGYHNLDTYMMCVNLGHGAGNANTVSIPAGNTGSAPFTVGPLEGDPPFNPNSFLKLLGFSGSFTGNSGGAAQTAFDGLVNADNTVSGGIGNIFFIGTNATITSSASGTGGTCDLF